MRKTFSLKFWRSPFNAKSTNFRPLNPKRNVLLLCGWEIDSPTAIEARAIRSKGTARESAKLLACGGVSCLRANPPGLSSLRVTPLPSIHETTETPLKL
jgi:hypothetical protein